MTTYLYGLILDRNAHLVPPHITGVGGAALRVATCGSIAALASTIGRAPKTDDLKAVRAHDHALQNVVNHGATATSVRFGQTFADDDELRRHVARLECGLAQLLERQDGCVEMRVLLVVQPEMLDTLGSAGGGPNPDAPKPKEPAQRKDGGPGRAYLEKLKAARSGQHPSGMNLKHLLGAVVLAERVEDVADGRFTTFSHLIRRDDEPAYRAAVARQAFLVDAPVVGPTAFFSFAGLDDE